jgi:hypothetical protein
VIYYKKTNLLIMLIWNVNSNGDNVVESNPNNIGFFFFENCENQLQKQISYVVFSRRC